MRARREEKAYGYRFVKDDFHRLTAASRFVNDDFYCIASVLYEPSSGSRCLIRSFMSLTASAE